MLKGASRAVAIDLRWYIAGSLSPISGYQTDPSGGTLQAWRGNLYVTRYSGTQYVCQVLFKIDGKLKSSTATSPKKLPPTAMVHGVSSNADRFYFGQKIHLICRTPSFVEPRWIWTDGVQIESDGSHRRVDQIGNLEIFAANRTDSHTYRCCGQVQNETPLPDACVDYPVNVLGKKT